MGNDPDGWMEIGANYTLSFPNQGMPDFGHNFGLHLHGVDRANWGLGFSLIFGDSLFELTFNFVYLFSFFDHDPLNFPLYIKAGWINTGIGVAVEAGIRYFFAELGTPSGDNTALAGELLGGLHMIFYSFFGDPDDSIGMPLLIPTAAFNLGFAFPAPESSGYWIY